MYHSRTHGWYCLWGHGLDKNTAKLIDFVPKIKTTSISVPDSVALVIANSLTPSPKLLTLGTRYNKRVVECRFATAILAVKLKRC